MPQPFTSLHRSTAAVRLRALLLPALCAGGLAACTQAAAPPEPVRAVRTMVVAAGDAGLTREYAAEVRARIESRLGFRVGGKLVRRSVELGDAVRAGQVLAQLDAQDLRLGQDSARAALASAQASYELAQADYRRYQELLAQGFISAAELERRDTALKAARATLDQARAQAAVQGNQAGYAALVADAAGVVTGVDAEPGQVVAAGASVIRLAHDGPRDAVFSVPEDRQAELRALIDRPAAVKVRPWGSSSTLPATVREVAAAADPATRTFLVKADVGSAALRPGQTVTVLVDSARAPGVIKLPLSALLQVDGRSAVWLFDAASLSVRPQPVQVAGADGNEVVLAAGLQPGQEIVVAGVHLLTPGQRVKRFVADGAPVAAASAPASR